MTPKDCVFCQIVTKQAPANIVWEDKEHLAFLSIYPNTDGFTVVIPKKHYSSYIFAQDEKVISELVIAAQKVAKKIDSAFEDVGRTGLVAEGMMVDHLHLKLIPLHGTTTDSWRPVVSSVDKFFDKYEGYISSHNFKREDDEKLLKVAEKIRKSKT